MKKGFTVVELLIVIAVIALVVAILFAYGKAKFTSPKHVVVSAPFRYGTALDDMQSTAQRTNNVLTVIYQSTAGVEVGILEVRPTALNYHTIIADVDGDGLADLPKRGDDIWEVHFRKWDDNYSVISTNPDEALRQANKLLLGHAEREKD